MKRIEHEKQSIELFGKPYTEVHAWLDYFAGSPEYGYRHRHHLAGIKLIGELFGTEAMEAGKQHIISDLKDEGWTEADEFPKDERHYVNMGLF